MMTGRPSARVSATVVACGVARVGVVSVEEPADPPHAVKTLTATVKRMSLFIGISVLE